MYLVQIKLKTDNFCPDNFSATMKKTYLTNGAATFVTSLFAVTLHCCSSLFMQKTDHQLVFI